MNQFQTNDIVLYGSNGCCRISEIETRESGSYYILTPVHKDRTKFMVPTDNENLVSRIRPVPSKKAVHDCIRRAAAAEPSWIDDNAARKEAAKDVLANGDEFDLLMLARSFHQHKQHVMQIGKKTTSSDSSILRSAQDHIRDEFSVVFGIEPEEVDAFIGGEASSSRG